MRPGGITCAEEEIMQVQLAGKAGKAHIPQQPWNKTFFPDCSDTVLIRVCKIVLVEQCHKKVSVGTPFDHVRAPASGVRVSAVGCEETLCLEPESAVGPVFPGYVHHADVRLDVLIAGEFGAELHNVPV